MASSDPLLKRIWFLWLRGVDNAPDVVQQCHRSWQVRNPGWELVSLDADNLSCYLGRDEIGLPVSRQQARSDLIRINLLRKYGGVWADASCFCVKPLDDWLWPYLGSGFFAFANPGPDRLLSSWFLASEQEHYVTARWASAANAYWSGPTAPRRLVGYRTARWATRLLPDLWFRAPARMLRIYPYYWFHYLFNHLYDLDQQFRAGWDATPKFPADVPHAAHRHGLTRPIQPWLRQEIDRKVAPLYKLNWRIDETPMGEGSAVQYLYRSL